jgi:uncharacterized membrane protein YidH (DUF202 family)
MSDLFTIPKKSSRELLPPHPPPTSPVDTSPSSPRLSRDVGRSRSESRDDDGGTLDPSPIPPHQDPNQESKPIHRPLSSFVRALSPSLTLVNSGSVARDHLASERTFLAYVRTSLAIASTGVGELIRYVFAQNFNICNAALVQLFTISGNKSVGLSAFSSPRGIQVYARPLGATTVLLGMIVLSAGAYQPPPY